MNALDLPEKPFLKELPSKRMTLKLSQVGHAQSLWQTIKKDRELGSSTWAYVHSLDQAKDYLRKKSLKNPGPEITYFLFSKKNELMGSVHLHTFSYADHRVEIGYWVSRVCIRSGASFGKRSYKTWFSSHRNSLSAKKYAISEPG